MLIGIILLLAGLQYFRTADSAAAQQTYGGYECTDDCSGHKAGFEWAQQNDIQDESDCEGSSSQSFAEGCKVYVENPGRNADYDDDGEFL